MKKILFLFLLFLFGGADGFAADFTFDVMSDSHLMLRKDGAYQCYAATKDVVAQIKKDRPDFVIHCGDMISINSRNGSSAIITQMWAEFDKVVTHPFVNAGIPFFITKGNHDIYGKLGKEMYESHWKDYRVQKIAIVSGKINDFYCFEYKDCMFIVLDGSGISIGEAQAKWLEAQLKKASGKKALFVISHVGLKGMARHKDDYMRGKLPDMMKKCSKVYFLSGHHHLYDYEKMGDITHIISPSSGETPPVGFLRITVREDGGVTVRQISV